MLLILDKGKVTEIQRYFIVYLTLTTSPLLTLPSFLFIDISPREWCVFPFLSFTATHEYPSERLKARIILQKPGETVRQLQLNVVFPLLHTICIYKHNSTPFYS